MKLYLDEQQTAKLIELGFEKPRSSVECELPKGDWRIGAVGIRKAYSIGELLSFLPEFVNWTPRVIRGNVIEYSFETEGSELYYCNAHYELIDNLYDMILRLKEEGVI